MTRDGLTQEEKTFLHGMRVVLTEIDICAHFKCHPDGCDECPLAKVVNAQEDLDLAISRVILEK